MTTRTCKDCHEELPLERFSLNRKHGKEYRMHRCNCCRRIADIRKRECRQNRRISELLRWAAPLVMVIGVYQYDFVSKGGTRFCWYESELRAHVLLIDEDDFCPRTWEFEVDQYNE